MGILYFSPNYFLGQLVQDQGPIGSIHWACWKKDSAQSIQAKREEEIEIEIVNFYSGFWWKCLPRQVNYY